MKVNPADAVRTFAKCASQMACLAFLSALATPSLLHATDPVLKPAKVKVSHSEKIPRAEIVEDVIDDSAITEQVKMAILSNLLLNTKVESSHGIVTLTGTARSMDDKNLNTKLATEVSGVKKVVNLLSVPTTMVTSN